MSLLCCIVKPLSMSTREIVTIHDIKQLKLGMSTPLTGKCLRIRRVRVNESHTKTRGRPIQRVKHSPKVYCNQGKKKLAWPQNIDQ
jgi:hypothetical protein